MNITPYRSHCRYAGPSWIRSVVAVAIVGVITPVIRASRSGLNNVPTADTQADGTGNAQGYTYFGPNRATAYMIGTRFGFAPAGQRIEAGLDSRWLPGKAVPAFLNAKWGWARDGFPASFGVGVANFGLRKLDRSRLGQPQSYGVVSWRTPVVRLHGGYFIQAENNGAFVGLDRSWNRLGRKLTFRSDLQQIQNRAQMLASVGVTCRLTPAVTMELWQSKPTKRGESYTALKFSYAFTTRAN